MLSKKPRDHHGGSKHERLSHEIEKLEKETEKAVGDSSVLDRLFESLKEHDARHAAYLEWEKAWKSADKETRLILLIQRNWNIRPVESVSLDDKQDNIPFAPPLSDQFNLDAEVRNQSPPKML
jgi:hypothetical protein